MKTQTQDCGISDLGSNTAGNVICNGGSGSREGNQRADMQREAGSLCYSRTGTAKPLQFSLMDHQGSNVQVISVLPSCNGEYTYFW